MLQHPWILLAEYLRENWYTQKDFSKKIWKKTSEINELIRGKRNITVARDIILTKYLSTEPKFWILKQLDYDYEQILLKEQDSWIVTEIDNVSSWEDKDVLKINLDDKTFSYELTSHDILEEEKRQTKYLKENILFSKKNKAKYLFEVTKMGFKEVTSRQNHFVKYMLTLKDKKTRDREKTCLVEGLKILFDLAEKQYPIRMFFTTSEMLKKYPKET